VNFNGYIIEWAMDRGYRCAYSRHPQSAAVCLRLTLQHATAWFDKGRLQSLDCRRDGRYANEMAREIAVLFALCGQVDVLREVVEAARCELASTNDRAPTHCVA
jgi:hypothetical protein